MSALDWPHHLLTLDDWAELPETSEFHIEVVEGVLSVAPRPLPLHQLAIGRLAYLIAEQLPAEQIAVGEIEVVIETTPLTVRAPDVVVAPTGLVRSNLPRLDAADVSLVVEVLSEGTKRTDRVTKLFEYADAGIEHYWIVDLDTPVSVITYRLVDGDYENFGEFSGKTEFDFGGTALTIDLDALVAGRAQRL
jgi:Uma2 family endonuclease